MRYQTLINGLLGIARYIFSKPLLYSVRTKIINQEYLPIGGVNFGDLRRVTPVSNQWGHDRGLPIDRYYIENFLASNANHIKGRTLEIGDNNYTLQYGKTKVTKSDVLNLLKNFHPSTTIIADITSAPDIPSNTFDCIIFTQTLQYTYDVHAAIETLHRILKPGGILLATFPAISQTGGFLGKYWYWNFTPISADKLFKEFFTDDNIEMQAYGNVLVATSFLQGLCKEDLLEEELESPDPNFAICISVKASKPN